jgi:signal peptidase I
VLEKTEIGLLTRAVKKLLGLVGIRDSEEKMRGNAANWLELADKVWHYRCDQLSEADRKELRTRIDELRAQCRQRAEAPKLKLLIEQLEETLRHLGGMIYPKSTLVDYVEFLLVAAIVILGVRTYIVQPFKIPTNSMWPSYYGMTAEVYRQPDDVPGPLKQAARFVFFGARHREVIAPESGPITVPVFVSATRVGGRLSYERKPGRSWLMFPTEVRDYVFYVNEAPVHLQVPLDFDFDTAFQDAMGLTVQQLAAAADGSQHGSNGFRWVTLPQRTAERGKPLISFDLLTGDQLFVDRVSYHFMPPQVGQGFVFRTGKIPGIGEDQYYIKRLAGVPGDKLEIRQPVLYRNGAPIAGAAAFDLNAKRIGRYAGYFNIPSDLGAQYLSAGTTMTVPANSYFALGDNSGNSRDGRYWGFVPAKEVVGRPLFIYYPFTRRWGPAR